MKRILKFYISGALVLSTFSGAFAASNVIEKQLQEIGSIPNDEVVVVQRKFTRKAWRHEITPITFGGLPFGTVRRTLFGGASYSLHLNDWLAVEPLNFVYTKNFFSGFTDDVNKYGGAGGGALSPRIAPDYQKLLFFLTSGLQFTPTYGKMSTFSRWIAYMEPFASIGAGLAKTESNSYLALVGGIGFRTYFREWFSMKFEFRDYIYSEKSVNRDTGSDQTVLRNNYAVMLSLSFWLPKMP